MNLDQIVNDLKAHFQTAEETARRFLEEHLPAVENLAQKAATNPALNAILAAEHLQEVPEFLATVADWITKADAALANAKAAGAAEATAAAQAQAQAAAEQPEAVPGG